MTNHTIMNGSAEQISQREAIEIAARKAGARPEDMTVVCQDDGPRRFTIYNELAEPCWWILAPHADGPAAWALRSSRVVLVGRQTGVVHYDGSAHDEG